MRGGTKITSVGGARAGKRSKKNSVAGVPVPSRSLDRPFSRQAGARCCSVITMASSMIRPDGRGHCRRAFITLKLSPIAFKHYDRDGRARVGTTATAINHDLPTAQEQQAARRRRGALRIRIASRTLAARGQVTSSLWSYQARGRNAGRQLLLQAWASFRFSRRARFARWLLPGCW